MTPGKLRHVDPHQVIERYLQGVGIYQQAAELGVSHVSLYARLRSRASSTWRSSMVLKPKLDLSRATFDRDSCSDKHSIAYVRRRILRARLWLERACKRTGFPFEKALVIDPKDIPRELPDPKAKE